MSLVRLILPLPIRSTRQMNLLSSNGLCMILLMWIISAGCSPREHTGEEKPDSTSDSIFNQTDRYGRRQGPWKIFEDSLLVGGGSYIDGKEQGLWQYWYSNGQKKEEGHFKRGVKEGMWTEWYMDGDLMWKGEWSGGKQHVEFARPQAEVTFSGIDQPVELLEPDSSYHVKIRIVNVPVSHVYVETDRGSITPEEGTDRYLLHTPDDSVMTLAIGYIPDLEFRDFRNLVREIDYRIR